MTINTALVLREDQITVLEAALEYVLRGEQRSEEEGAAYGRIILPPRSGKTIIAALMIDRLRSTTIFLAPTKVLVEQAAAYFRSHVRDMPVSVLTGTSRSVGDEGVLVATYHSIANLLKTNKLPRIVREASLVFADEAHHAMTDIRQGVMRDAFPPDAVRIALTATPDYNEVRVLSRYFPDLIHELTIQEGVQMQLLAPVHAMAVGVDAGASNVRVFAGEYNQEDMGIVMSRAPLLKAIEAFRYQAGNAEMPALICCTTRAQAMAVFEYLAGHRPEGTPCPAPVLGDMTDDMRNSFLDQYQRGILDTLIAVGVLIEGWNSPRCKLLIDAAPSMSQVRAAQKFTRVMTKDGDREAKIIMLVPEGLLAMPVTPLDVVGPGLDTMDAGEVPVPPQRVGPPKKRNRSSAWERLRASGIKIRSIDLRTVLLEDVRLDRIPKIARQPRFVRRVVRSGIGNLDWRWTTYGRFMRYRFRVDHVSIRGAQLLRFLGFSANLQGYDGFLTKYFPKIAADRLLGSRGHTGSGHVRSVRDLWNDALRHMGLEEIEGATVSQKAYADKSWLEELEQPSGFLDHLSPEQYWPLDRVGEDLLPPDAVYEKSEAIASVLLALADLNQLERFILRKRFGLDGEEELTLAQVGELILYDRERVRQIQETALSKIRKYMREGVYQPIVTDKADWQRFLESYESHLRHHGWYVCALGETPDTLHRRLQPLPFIWLEISKAATTPMGEILVQRHWPWLIWKMEDGTEIRYPIEDTEALCLHYRAHYVPFLKQWRRDVGFLQRFPSGQVLQIRQKQAL